MVIFLYIEQLLLRNSTSFAYTRFITTNSHLGGFVSITSLLKFNAILLIFLTLLFSCASTVHIQPHATPISTTHQSEEEAAIYISPTDLSKVHSQSLFFGGDIKMPLGTPLKELSQEAFSPFFRRIFFSGSNSPNVAPYVIEVGLGNFDVTQGLDTHLTINCKVNKKGESIFVGDFEGKGSGTAAAGLLGESLAREQIRKSAEAAFIDAFKKVQTAYKEFIEQ